MKISAAKSKRGIMKAKTVEEKLWKWKWQSSRERGILVWNILYEETGRNVMSVKGLLMLSRQNESGEMKMANENGVVSEIIWLCNINANKMKEKENTNVKKTNISRNQNSIKRTKSVSVMKKTEKRK